MGEAGRRYVSAEGAIRPKTLRQKDHQVQSTLESGSKKLPAHGEKARALKSLRHQDRGAAVHTHRSTLTAKQMHEFENPTL